MRFIIRISMRFIFGILGLMIRTLNRRKCALGNLMIRVRNYNFIRDVILQLYLLVIKILKRNLKELRVFYINRIRNIRSAQTL